MLSAFSFLAFVTLSVGLILGISPSMRQGALAQSPVANIEVTQPRAFGYQLGDKFERIIKLTLNKPYTLDESSLPEPGRLIPWLSIEAPQVIVTENKKTWEYLITLSYQIINIDKDALDIGVTDHKISIKNGEEILSLLIQPVRIKAVTIAPTTGNDLQPDHRPQTISVDQRTAMVLGFILLGSLLAFLALTFGLPFLKQAQPFTRSYRQLNKTGKGHWTAVQYSDALKTTHGAFNETAGHVVFFEELDDFLAQHPSFEAYAEQIKGFFSHSRAYYFSEGDNIESEFSQDKLLNLLKHCSVSERGFK